MVDAARVVARFCVAFDAHLDYDQPEDPVDALRSSEYVYWDKVDEAFQRYVKRSVTPLIKNPALPSDKSPKTALAAAADVLGEEMKKVALVF